MGIIEWPFYAFWNTTYFKRINYWNFLLIILIGIILTQILI